MERFMLRLSFSTNNNSTIKLMKAELYILGVLHRGDFHPYEIKRRLTQAMIECFTEVDVGTLYYAVRQLAECWPVNRGRPPARGSGRHAYRLPHHSARTRPLS